MHKDDPKELLTARQPMGHLVQVKDIVDAIVYLTEAGQVTGEVLPKEEECPIPRCHAHMGMSRASPIG